MTRLLLLTLIATLHTGCGSRATIRDSFQLASGDAMTIRIEGEEVESKVTNTGAADLNLEGVFASGANWQREMLLYSGTPFSFTTSGDVQVMISNNTGSPGGFAIESTGGEDLVFSSAP